MYTPSNSAGPEYEIESDRHGNYAIKLNGKVLKRVTALTHYLGKPRWGSKKLEIDAVEDAKRDVDALNTHMALYAPPCTVGTSSLCHCAVLNC